MLRITVKNPNKDPFKARVEKSVNGFIGKMKEIIKGFSYEYKEYEKSHLLVIDIGDIGNTDDTGGDIDDMKTDPIEISTLIKIYEEFNAHEMFSVFNGITNKYMLTVTFKTIDYSNVEVGSDMIKFQIDDNDDQEEILVTEDDDQEDTIGLLDIPAFARDKESQQKYSKNIHMSKAVTVQRNLNFSEMRNINNFYIKLDEILNYSLGKLEMRLIRTNNDILEFTVDKIINVPINILVLHNSMIYDESIIKNIKFDFSNDRLFVEFIPVEIESKTKNHKRSLNSENRFMSSKRQKVEIK